MILFSSLSKRAGVVLTGVFSLALSSVLLLCGAGPVPIQNLLPQGSMQGDLNAGGHSVTNAATVSAATVTASTTLNVPTNFFSNNNVVLTSGSYANPSWITGLAWSKISGAPTTLSGYGITDPIVLTSGSYSNPSWITGLGWSKISSTPTTLSGYGITDAYTKTATDARYLQIANNLSELANAATARMNLRVANSYSTLSISAAGNTNLSASGPVNANTITLGVGSGTYAASISLLDSGAVTGDLYELNVSIPASSNPTLTIYDNSTGGTALASVTSNGITGNTTLSFFFNGTSWTAYKKGALLLYQNLADLSSASAARTNLGLGTLATQNGTFSGTSSGTNTGDQTITLTGDATGSGTGSFAVTVGKIGGQAVSLAGSLTTSGANALTFTTTGTTNVTLPTSGTLLTTTGSGSSLTGLPTSVSNSDGTLTLSPTTGSVVASLNLAHANTWTATPTFPGVNVTGTGSVNMIATSTLNSGVASAQVINDLSNRMEFDRYGSTRSAYGVIPSGGGTMYSNKGSMAFAADDSTGLILFGIGPSVPERFRMSGTAMTFTSANLIFATSGDGITGTTINDSANAGTVGEIISSAIAGGSAVSLTTATAANVTSLSLSAGDWDVEGNINFIASAATVTATLGGISTTTATVPTDGTEVYSGLQTITVSATDSITLPRKRISLSGVTSIYLVGKSTFSAGTVTAFGSITARRIR